MTLPIRNSRLRLSQGQLFWCEIGQGTPIVFLHGAWNDSSQWATVIQQLGIQQLGKHRAYRYHCLAPDLLGFGESERPKVHYSVHLQVECLLEWLDALRLAQVYIVAEGLGAWVATQLALKYPERVQGLVLLAPEGISMPQAASRWRWARWLTQPVPIAYWLLQAIAPLAKLMKRSGPAGLLQQRKIWRRSPVACQLLFQRRHAEIRAEQVQTQLPWLTVPVRLLQFEGDRSIGTALTQAYAAALQVPVTLLPGDETLLLDSPESITTQIETFIDSGRDRQAA
ncbi:alpha/beta fold hydrolase [Leptolyngbya sp. AN02str]|uniref:alpha/beta fold hydrolase n=1 Tax=Leptolyngbya sp. AN02str TaxID=3423363 RepID=UPI003D31C713